MLNIKRIIMHGKFALKISVIHSRYCYVIFVPTVQMVIIKLLFWANLEVSISGDGHYRSLIML